MGRRAVDPAIIGRCRIGYFRIGVKDPVFDKVLTQRINQAACNAGGKTPCVQGGAKQGHTRHGVKIPLFDELLEQMKRR